MTLPPKIDRQREHQANERTFLAWLRTSIALIGFGFAIARFGIFIRQLEANLTQLIAIAAMRHNQVYWQIERGNYRPNQWIVWMMTIVVMIFGVFSIPLILWRSPIVAPAQNKQDRAN